MTLSLIHAILVLKYCESVVLYIIVLEVARKLSRFCKMPRTRKSKVVGPHCSSHRVAL